MALAAISAAAPSVGALDGQCFEQNEGTSERMRMVSSISMAVLYLMYYREQPLGYGEAPVNCLELAASSRPAAHFERLRVLHFTTQAVTAILEAGNTRAYTHRIYSVWWSSTTCGAASLPSSPPLTTTLSQVLSGSRSSPSSMEADVAGSFSTTALGTAARACISPT
jgi:hypothetical protein